MIHWEKYEEFVAALVTAIEKQLPITKLGYGRPNKLTGTSGAKHQVDVSFIDLTDSPPTLVLIECKRLRKRIGLSHVKILKATMDDLLNAPNLLTRVKAMFVTMEGVCSGETAKYAKHHGIETKVIRDIMNYSFTYKDHKVAGTVVTCNLSAMASNTYQSFKACQNCGKVFDATGNKSLCPECSVH